MLIAAATAGVDPVAAVRTARERGIENDIALIRGVRIAWPGTSLVRAKEIVVAQSRGYAHLSDQQGAEILPALLNVDDERLDLTAARWTTTTARVIR